MNIFKRLSLDIEEVSHNEVTDFDTNYIVNRLRNIDLDNLTPLEAFNIISELKGMYG